MVHTRIKYSSYAHTPKMEIFRCFKKLILKVHIVSMDQGSNSRYFCGTGTFFETFRGKKRNISRETFNAAEV